MSLLITSGATIEPIDDVRFLSNISTGRTGAQLADLLAQRQHAVTLLRAPNADKPPHPEKLAATDTFTTTQNLLDQLRAKLAGGTIDAVIQCAAVSDYRPDQTRAGKLSSDQNELTLRLVPTPKILPQIKTFSPRPLTVIGFKLTSNADEPQRQAAVEKLLSSGTVDYVIHNDLADRAASGDDRPFRIHAPRQAAVTLRGLRQLADHLHQILR